MPAPRRSLLVLAADEVRRFGGDTVEPEHLLLAILRPPDGIGAALLGAVGADACAVVSETERRAPRGSGPTPAGQLPVTVSVKAALERSFERARSLGAADACGVEHLLLALVEDDRSLASEVLREEGVDAERLRDAVIALHDAVDGALAEADSRARWTPGTRRAASRALAAAAASGEAEASTRRLARALLESEEVASALAAAGIASVAEPEESAPASPEARPIPRGWPPAAFDAWPVFDEATRDALRRAARLAPSARGRVVTAAHVLLALAREPDDARALFGDAEAGAKDVLEGLCGLDPDAKPAPDAGADDGSALAAPLPGAVSFFAPDAADALAEAVRLARRYGGRARASHLFFALCRGDPVRAALRSVPGGAAFARDAAGAEERALAEEGGPAPPVDLDPALLAVVSVAMAAAAAKGRARVSASDLLLALLVDEGAGARALRDAGVDLAALRDALEER